jgi:hypothetical protein
MLRAFSIMLAAVAIGIAADAGAQGAKPLKKCAPDAVIAGTVCMDRYEASAWRVPDPLDGNAGLVKRIQQGRASLADLTAGGATPLGTTGDDYAPCADNGQNCVDDVYAVSLPSVTPAAHVTWFQAQAACENARKRLPSNAEWQAAVLGTPDPGPDDGTTDCNSNGSMVAATGSRSACVSARGAFDLVGNLYEWVADWVPGSGLCGAWNPNVSAGDDQCIGGALVTGGPGALLRGGPFDYAGASGPLAIFGLEPSSQATSYGFRCAR